MSCAKDETPASTVANPSILQATFCLVYLDRHRKSPDQGVPRSKQRLCGALGDEFPRTPPLATIDDPLDFYLPVIIQGARGDSRATPPERMLYGFHENGGSLTANLCAIVNSTETSCCVPIGRQSQADRRILTLHAYDVDRTTIVVHELLDDTQSQSGAGHFRSTRIPGSSSTTRTDLS